MTVSKTFFYFSLSFIIGILLNSLFLFNQLIALAFLIPPVFLISVFWERKKIVMVGFCLLFLSLGIMRHQQAVFNIPEIYENEISFIGQVAAEPDIRENHIKLILFTELVPGKVLISVDKYPKYEFDDKLKITGELKKPEAFEGFNYPDYLAKDGIYSVMYFPEVEFLGQADSNLTSRVYNQILLVKNKLRESIGNTLSEPQSSVLGALILGDKRKLSDDIKNKLNAAGLRHITAVSGLHIMILAGILMSFGLFLGFSRKISFYLVLAFLVFFIILVGLPPSAVRAGIMMVFFLLSQVLGRPRSGLRVIVLTATAMLLINPLLLKSDVGFQLSFLAILGITCFMTPFQRYLKSSVLSVTLSAQVFTLPILIYNFGYFSLISPVTNILVVPFLPFVMILGFAGSIIGLIWLPLGYMLFWPAWLMLSYIIKIAEVADSLSLSLYNVHFGWLIAFYLVLGIFILKVRPKIKRSMI
ncbi:MAG: ComEC/Rec2 family competence protein [Candidatus Nealsonbacteria bacterium]